MKLADAVAIAERNADARNRTFYGWAVITARKAATGGRQVRASPQPGNPCHADIVLPASAAKEKEEQIRHAQELADNSIWRVRPAASEPP